MENSSSLNYVVAFIQPFQLDAVVDALRKLPQFPGMGVCEVRGFASHLASPAGRRRDGGPYRAPGDGKVFAGPVTLAYRIRTATWGEDAVRP